ncbi:eCIS core domain-containing protein [Nostoc sp. JL23]|uniref:eCIS core domain-containing protein n=1 Tax=unclassified Nostoc TaxID=2593658 RepID=UPI00345B6F8F
MREPMEQAFGADFSGVKVHTNGQSDQLNRSIQARAFTTGQDVFFREGEYNPGSQGGQELLTHVVQQNGGR